MKNKKMKLIILIIIIAALIIFACISLIKRHNYSKQELLSYQYSSGGDMNGGHYSQKLTKIDDNTALMTISQSEWHYQDNQISEYLLDGKVLEEIKDIFLKNAMYKWENRNFSNIFVADGASYSYSFNFNEDSIHFSSQIYSQRYARKLNKIDDIINKYQTEEKLPGLVIKEKSDEEIYASQNPQDNLIHIEVYEYSQNRIYYRIANGTDEEIALDDMLTIYNDKDEIIVQNNKDYQLSPHSINDDYLKLNIRLTSGNYHLIYGEYNTEFEIK